jgi:hypothetical protein
VCLIAGLGEVFFCWMFSVTWVTRGDFPGPELDTSVVFFCYVWTPALAEWGWVLPRNERDGVGN